MPRTSWIAVFAVSIFVSGVSFVTSKATSTTTLSHPVKTSDSSAATTESVASTVRYERNETTPHVGNSSELSKRVSSNNETVTSSENERNEKDCHMTEEAKDMLNCFVVTSDVTSPELTTNPSQENGTNKTEQEISKFNDTYPPKIFPHDKDVKSIAKADEATRRRLNHSFYATFSPAEVEAASSSTDGLSSSSKNNNGKTTNTESSVTNTSNVRNSSLKSDSKIVAQKSTNKEGTSQGTIMLTMVVTLAIAIAAIYAGVVVWKRYLVYRYSHRQLLDNDSEFDANDLHYFEL